MNVNKFSAHDFITVRTWMREDKLLKLKANLTELIVFYTQLVAILQFKFFD